MVYLKRSNHLSDTVNELIIRHNEFTHQQYLEYKKKQKVTADISQSSLLDGARIYQLGKIYTDLENETSNVIDAMVGHIFEDGFCQLMGNDYQFELPLTYDINGAWGKWTISMRMDMVKFDDDKKIHIKDFKFTSSYTIKTVRKEIYEYEKTKNPEVLKHKYIWQMLGYAYGSKQNGYDVQSLSLITYNKHWSYRLASEDKSFPPSSLYEIQIPLIDMQFVENYLQERVTYHQGSDQHMEKSGHPVLCTAEDMWIGDHKPYAVMMKGKKRAVKLFDNLESADSFAESIQDGYVEHRPMPLGIRCRDYCIFAKNNVCDQYNRKIKELNNGQ